MAFKSPSGSQPYDALAAAYDVSGQSRFSLKMVGYLLELLALRRIRPHHVADLACGTGAAAVALARRRFQVTGLDGSAAMLERARRRGERWRVEVEWLQGDLVDLPRLGTTDRGVDLALCLYDSLNHLTTPLAFRQALAGARRLLAPGGHLFFDMNTPHAYATVWGDSQDAWVGPSHARFWCSGHDPATGLATLQATYFLPRPDGSWQRVDASHTARGYAHAFVLEALAEAGFECLEAYEALTFRPVSSTTYRAAYLARA
ncbi:MAG: class I SAM-dependent methyltransferase [Candidatus Sericytochromatia bacterium]|nr:class I SAM-dependent methyltransferase [Candidatus Sericytochromatia bacterium]